MSEQENAVPELQVNLAETPPAPALELADRQREQKQAAVKESMTLKSA